MKRARILENRKTWECFWQCSCDFLGPLRNQYGTTHLILTIVSCASEHLSRFGYCFFFFGFSVLVPVFIALCGFFSNFSIWFSVFVKNTYGLLDLVSDVVFGFSYLEIRFLLDLSGSFAKSVLFVYYSKWISTCDFKERKLHKISRNERVSGRAGEISKEIGKITSEPSAFFSQIWVLATLDLPTWPNSSGSFSLSKEFDF